MNYFLYDDYVLVKLNDKEYPLTDIFKKTKTRTLTNENGFKLRIKTNEIRISPKTYHNIGIYDAQFEDYDMNCYLCGFYGGSRDKCKCKTSFTIEEHKVNLYKARRRYIKSIFSNNFKNSKNLKSKIKLLSNVQVDELLFTERKGIRVLKIYNPSIWSKDRVETINNMLTYVLDKFEKFNLK